VTTADHHALPGASNSFRKHFLSRRHPSPPVRKPQESSRPSRPPVQSRVAVLVLHLDAPNYSSTTHLRSLSAAEQVPRVEDDWPGSSGNARPRPIHGVK